MDRQELQDLAIRLALGELDPKDHEMTRALLVRDAELVELERLVREAIGSMRTDHSVSAPMHVREAAKRLMSGAARADWVSELTKVLSAWIPKPTLGGVPGYRGPGDDGHAEYSSEAGTVHLMVSPPEGGASHWRVRGAIDSKRGTATEVAFVRTEGDRAVAGHGHVEPDGKFRVDVPRGVFDVYIRLSDAALEIKELRIG